LSAFKANFKHECIIIHNLDESIYLCSFFLLIFHYRYSFKTKLFIFLSELFVLTQTNIFQELLLFLEKFQLKFVSFLLLWFWLILQSIQNVLL
jgi:hypothetical protein